MFSIRDVIWQQNHSHFDFALSYLALSIDTNYLTYFRLLSMAIFSYLEDHKLISTEEILTQGPEVSNSIKAFLINLS